MKTREKKNEQGNVSFLKRSLVIDYTSIWFEKFIDYCRINSSKRKMSVGHGENKKTKNFNLLWAAINLTYQNAEFEEKKWKILLVGRNLYQNDDSVCSLDTCLLHWFRWYVSVENKKMIVTVHWWMFSVLWHSFYFLSVSYVILSNSRCFVFTLFSSHKKRKKEQRIRFLYVRLIEVTWCWQTRRLSISLFFSSVFSVICFRRWGIAKDRRNNRPIQREEKNERRIKKKFFVHVCWFVDVELKSSSVLPTIVELGFFTTPCFTFSNSSRQYWMTVSVKFSSNWYHSYDRLQSIRLMSIEVCFAQITTSINDNVIHVERETVSEGDFIE